MKDKDLYADFELIKRDFARFLLGFLKKRNFLMLNNTYNFEYAMLVQARNYAAFFSSGVGLRIMRVREWSL